MPVDVKIGNVARFIRHGKDSHLFSEILYNLLSDSEMYHGQVVSNVSSVPKDVGVFCLYLDYFLVRCKHRVRHMVGGGLLWLG